MENTCFKPYARFYLSGKLIRFLMFGEEPAGAEQSYMIFDVC